MPITVWQKQEFDERNIPPLKARLTYQISPDKQKVYCKIEFETPYPISKDCLKNAMKAMRYGDKMICYFEVPDGHYKTLRIDHPEQPIYGCTTYYNHEKSPVPYFYEPTYNMEIEMKEGYVYMQREER